MQKYTFVKISSILQCQNIPQGIRIRLENQSPTGDNKTSQKLKIAEKIYRKFFMKYPVSRIVPKTLRSPLCLQNVSFPVQIMGISIKTNWKKVGKQQNSDIAC